MYCINNMLKNKTNISNIKKYVSNTYTTLRC